VRHGSWQAQVCRRWALKNKPLPGDLYAQRAFAAVTELNGPGLGAGPSALETNRRASRPATQTHTEPACGLPAISGVTPWPLAQPSWCMLHDHKHWSHRRTRSLTAGEIPQARDQSSQAVRAVPVCLYAETLLCLKGEYQNRGFLHLGHHVRAAPSFAQLSGLRYTVLS